MRYIKSRWLSLAVVWGLLIFCVYKAIILWFWRSYFRMAGIPFPPFNKEAVQQIVESANKLIPSEQSREELHQQLQLLVAGALSKMDLLTRDEFDAQTAVLHRMQQRIEQLESQLAALSEKLDKQS